MLAPAVYAHSLNSDISVRMRNSPVGLFKTDWANISRVCGLSRRLIFERTIQSIKEGETRGGDS